MRFVKHEQAAEFLNTEKHIHYKQGSQNRQQSRKGSWEQQIHRKFRYTEVYPNVYPYSNASRGLNTLT